MNRFAIQKKFEIFAIPVEDLALKNKAQKSNKETRRMQVLCVTELAAAAFSYGKQKHDARCALYSDVFLALSDV